MNGIEKITQRIDQDAQAEIDAIIAQAQTEADAITARYAAQAEKEKEKAIARSEANSLSKYLVTRLKERRDRKNDQKEEQ